MNDLSRCFKKFKVYCGCPDPDDYISHSGLSEIKRVLLNNSPFLGDEIHLKIGAEVHLRSLKFKKSKFRFKPEIEKNIKGMVKALKENELWQFLMKVCEKEKEHTRNVLGVKLKVILDLKGKGKYKRLGADLKTTSCKTERAFIKAALEKYDYLRQGWLYKQAEGLDEFYFIGVQKTYPYNIFIFDVADYAKEEAAIAKETKWLIWFYKKFGRAFVKGAPDRKRKKSRTRPSVRRFYKKHGSNGKSSNRSMRKRNKSRRYI